MGCGGTCGGGCYSCDCETIYVPEAPPEFGASAYDYNPCGVAGCPSRWRAPLEGLGDLGDPFPPLDHWPGAGWPFPGFPLPGSGGPSDPAAGHPGEWYPGGPYPLPGGDESCAAGYDLEPVARYCYPAGIVPGGGPTPGIPEPTPGMPKPPIPGGIPTVPWFDPSSPTPPTWWPQGAPWPPPQGYVPPVLPPGTPPFYTPQEVEEREAKVRREGLYWSIGAAVAGAIAGAVVSHALK